jgi:drug/metabolite transporter (DMT)-like permease
MFHHAMALITSILWSFSYIHLIALGRYVTPEQLVVLRFEFSALALAAILLLRRPKLRGLSRTDWLLIIGIGLASGPAYHLVLSWAATNNRIDASLLGLIIATIPIFVGVLAWVCLGERPTLRRVLGLTLGLGGVGVVIWSKADHASRDMTDATPFTLAGPLAVLCGAIIAAVNTVMSRAARHAVGPIDLTCISGLIAISVCLAMHPFVGMQQVLNMPWQGWWAAFYLGFVAIGIANFSWYTAVAGLPAGSVAMYLFVPSVLSALWAWLWQDNHIGWGYIGGSALVLVGLLTGASGPKAEASVDPTDPAAIDDVFEESTLT